MDNEKQYEIESLQNKLYRAHQEIETLESQLRNEQNKHHATTVQRDEYKARSGQAYDTYVSQTHEGYVLQEDYATLEAQVAALMADRARLVEFVQELSTHQPHDNPLYGTLTAILWRFGERAAALLAELDTEGEVE